MKLDEFLVLSDTDVKIDEVVSVKTPDRKKQKIIDTYPVELREQIQSLETELKLTQKPLKKIKKELESEEVKQMELSNQIGFIKQRAVEIRSKTDQQNFIKRFRNRYSSFNECLDQRLKKLNQEEKEEVRTLLDDLKVRITEVEKYIK